MGHPLQQGFEIFGQGRQCLLQMFSMDPSASHLSSDSMGQSGFGDLLL